MPDQLPAERPFDIDAHVRRSRTGLCFVCAIREGHPDDVPDEVYEDPDGVGGFTDQKSSATSSVLVVRRTGKD